LIMLVKEDKIIPLPSTVTITISNFKFKKEITGGSSLNLSH